MAYARKRGSQILIVHGKRCHETGKVEQHILFTIYSKAEAREILGRGGNDGGAALFQDLMQYQYPDIRLDWKKIRKAIAAGMEVLPDTYEHKAVRIQARFREDLCAFTRQLLLADPQCLASSANLIRGNRMELEYLVDLIQWRLKLCDQEEDEWNRDTPFFWRFALQGHGVPPETEESAEELYDRGDYDRARAAFRLLIDCFDDYAEGHNYLGLIALQQDRVDEAMDCFRKTMEVGRRLFPRRIGRKRYWTDIKTRPYMRGMRNLTLALNRAGRYDEALALCDRLEKECGDDLTADSHRADVFLNTGRWQESADAARRLHQLWPSESLVAACALFEMGRMEESASMFLHGALNSPAAAFMLAARRPAWPSHSLKARDHNTGVELIRSLRAYFERGGRARRFFKRILSDRRVTELLDQKHDLQKRRWNEKPSERPETERRKDFERILMMEKPGFARREAAKILGARDS
ncbi:MAG: tetratricopeptide repeat protein [Pseudomonadota bacterium]